MVLHSGCRQDVLTRSSRDGIMLAFSGLRLDVFAIAATGPAEPIGMLLARGRPKTNLTSPARSRPLRRANLALMKPRRADTRRAAPL